MNLSIKNAKNVVIFIQTILSFVLSRKIILEKYNEIWERVKNIIQKNLIVNEYIMKNI